MIIFEEIPYHRPNYHEIEQKVKYFTNQLRSANTKEEFLENFKEINKLEAEIETNFDYADIRNMRNNTDSFFKTEITWWNQEKNKFDALFEEYYAICANASLEPFLYDRIPENFFSTMRYKSQISTKSILEEKKKEMELKGKYRELICLPILYKKEQYSLSAMKKFCVESDRSVRKMAFDAINDFYLQYAHEFDTVFQNLVITRNQMSKKLGFQDFATMSDITLRRFGYGRKEIQSFRDFIVKYIVPLKEKLKVWQQQNLEVEELKYYDSIFWKDGDPKSKRKEEEFLNSMGEVYETLSPKLGALYKKMLKNHYIDVRPSPNKVSYGITNYLVAEQMPVITANFKNTVEDVTTLNHEMGHAYQKYCSNKSAKIISTVLKYPTFEIAEMFSHAMEWIPLKEWQKIFLEEDYRNYSLKKLIQIIYDLPYFALVDHFQEEAYLQNGASFYSVWKSLARYYKEEEKITGHEALEKGYYFFRQSHIFENPFYYIDYALSYFGALSLWKDYEQTGSLETFEKMAQEASDLPLLKLVKKYCMPNPFEENSMKDLSIFLEEKIHENL